MVKILVAERRFRPLRLGSLGRARIELAVEIDQAAKIVTTMPPWPARAWTALRAAAGRPRARERRNEPVRAVKGSETVRPAR